MRRRRCQPLAVCTASFLLIFALTVVACGGGSGGSGRGLVVVGYEQSAVDNLPLNQLLQFTFSDAVDPASISPTSVQVRSGPNFGIEAPGTWHVEGPVLTFEPRLPGLCDYSDAGLQPNTDYRISLVGHPEEFTIRSVSGKLLEATSTWQSRTRDEEDPALFEDQMPGVTPAVASVTPASGSAEVPVMQGNRVVVEFSENIDPCSVDANTVLLHMFEVGDSDDGFIPVQDSAEDPFTWGSTNGVTQINPAQRIPSSIVLQQDFEVTRLTITPDFGEFPDNALLVLRLGFGIRDFSGGSLTPTTVSFTTENRPAQTGGNVVEYDDTTPINEPATTADVNTARSPGLAQGFLLFSGDGDNGADPYSPSRPNSMASGCLTPLQINDGVKDDFFPSTDVILDTGDTVNTCPNRVDGSTAVVWEFDTFRIPGGVTVRIIGVNPAIILVQREVLIESGGRLLVRGDGAGLSPRGAGAGASASTTVGSAGGTGVAGGGDGGDAPAYPAPGGRYGGDGVQGYFTTVSGAIDADVGESPGPGGGEGNTSGYWNNQSLCNRNVPSAGGGGHATEGEAGTALGSGASPVSIDLEVLGGGGGTYGSSDRRMLRAEAGSGGGAGGELRSFASTSARGPGGGGGAGGGFVDITCSGDIVVFGTIDAAGGRGGKGAGNPFNPNYTYNPGTGAGGGGSGGGIRLITASDIILGTTTVITAAGGAGGTGGTNQGTPAPVNPGGAGGMGRIVMEDSDTVISGISGAAVTPEEGTDGFYRGLFDPDRFSGGALDTVATTMPLLSGPIPIEGISPSYLEPDVTDFVAGIPPGASRGAGSTAILVEVRGWRMTVDGVVDIAAGPTEWSTVASLADSGVPQQPTVRPAVTFGIPTDITLAPDNPGTTVGLAHLQGYPYLQIRTTFYLPETATPLTDGPFVDRMTVRFSYDQ